jgi:hypothetical protein
MAFCEPIYAIVIAALFPGKSRELSGAFYAGAALVLAAVFAQGWPGSRRSTDT